MKRLRGWLFNLAAAVSLLLCVVTVAMWVRSYFVSDRITWRRDQVDQRDGLLWNFSAMELTSSRGWVSHSDYIQQGQPDTWNASLRERLAHSVDHRTVQWERTATTLQVRFWITRFGSETPLPYWLLATVFALLPLGQAWKKWSQNRQQKIGRCAVCGYDLRATPDRCPECGTVKA